MQVSRIEIISPDTVQQTISAVFAGEQYQRSLRRSLWEQLVGWIGRIINAVMRAMEDSPTLKWTVILSLAGIATAIAIRVAYVKRLDEIGGRVRLHDSKQCGRGNLWNLAQEEAAAGEFLQAAHTLYMAILESISRSDRIVIESSKTVGDYSRELRRKASQSLPLYREFAHLYEPVVWGTGRCDRESFDRLAVIAQRLDSRSG